VFLVHPRENRNAIGTARLAHLGLANSVLIEGNGFRFDQDPKIREFVSLTEFYPVVLYPGAGSLNLSAINTGECREAFPKNKKLVVFVIDGTWSLAKKMIQRSEILKALPQISFTPEKPSNYRIRVEPAFHCVSTIEAVHQILGKLEGHHLRHDQMLRVFNLMVEVQIAYELKSESPKTRLKNLEKLEAERYQGV